MFTVLPKAGFHLLGYAKRASKIDCCALCRVTISCCSGMMRVTYSFVSSISLLIVHYYALKAVAQQIAQYGGSFRLLAQYFLWSFAAFEVLAYGFPHGGQLHNVGMQLGGIFTFGGSAHYYAKVFRLYAFHYALQALAFFTAVYFPADVDGVVEGSHDQEAARQAKLTTKARAFAADWLL